MASHIIPPLISVQDFFRNIETSGYQISPDGNKLAFLKPYKHRLNIFIKKIDTENDRQITSCGKDIYQFFWKDDSTIIYIQDSDGDENFHIFSVNEKTNETKELTPYKNICSKIVDELANNPNEILIVMNKRKREIFDVFRLNIVNGSLSLEVKNPGYYMGYLTDHTGTVRVAIGKDLNNGDKVIHYRRSNKEPFKRIISFDYKETMTPLFFAGDNKKIYALSNINRDKQAFIIFNPDEIKEEDVLFERSDVDIKNAVMSQKRKVLTSVVYITDKTYRFYFDENTRCLYKYLFKHIVNQKVNITSMNKSETKFIVFASSDCNIGTYYLYDFIADKIIKLGNIAPWINPEHLASMKSIQYTSRDGHTINGYLTLPKVRESNNLPVIVYPHGGPWGRDYWCYNSIVQFLANRGYAVLQMNFRGSTGYGKAFLNAGDKQWGRKMQDDITDGVQWLITRGIANPERIAIYGSSYGGYAVLAGLTFTSDIYACGVDFAGPSNLFTLLESFPPYWKTELLEIYERIGHPEKDKQFLKEISPVFHVEKIKAPLLVIQGANDPRVSINESNQIVNALCARSIPVEYMVKKNEGHDFRNEENRIDLYKTIEKFLAKYLN